VGCLGGDEEISTKKIVYQNERQKGIALERSAQFAVSTHTLYSTTQLGLSRKLFHLQIIFHAEY